MDVFSEVPLHQYVDQCAKISDLSRQNQPLYHVCRLDRRAKLRNAADRFNAVHSTMSRWLGTRAWLGRVVDARVTRQERIAAIRAPRIRYSCAQAINLPLGRVEAGPLLDRIADAVRPIFNSHA